MGKIIINLTEMNATEVSDEDLVPIEDVSAPKTKSISISEMIARFKTGITSIAGLIKPFNVNYSEHMFHLEMNNSTATRSSITATTPTNFSAPYTYVNTTNYNQIIHFTFTCMFHKTATGGTANVEIYNTYGGGNVKIANRIYIDGSSTGWDIQTRSGIVKVPAGGGATFQPKGFITSGATAIEICNSTGDSGIYSPTLTGRIFRDDT